ncbi:hypothetical protein ACJ41O_001399 [Fusarium nematophilum]
MGLVYAPTLKVTHPSGSLDQDWVDIGPLLGGSSSRDSAGPPIKVTVEVKPPGNVLRRLFSIETTSMYRLTVTEVDEFDDQDAELMYQRFTAFLEEASRDRANPENDPLHYFLGRTLEHKQVLLRPPDPSEKPVPYILFSGVRNESEVRILHASLSRRKFRRIYFPPLYICYEYRQIQLTAAGNDEFSLLRLNLSNLIGAPVTTLCGAPIEIGTGQDRRVSTIGGMLESQDICYALTTSHRSSDEFPPDTETFFSSLDLTEDDYVDDIPSPLVVDRNGGRGGQSGRPPDQGTDNSMRLNQFTPLTPAGRIQCTGIDWALLKIDRPDVARPNMVDESALAGARQTSVSEAPIYFGELALKPKSGYVSGITAGTIVRTVQLLKKPARLKHPSGPWLTVWKARFELGPDSSMSLLSSPGLEQSKCANVPLELKRGDSGSWFVDTDTGTVYGHAMAATDEHVYMQPLVDILRDIRSKEGMSPKLASPFGQLAELAKFHYSDGNVGMGVYFAMRGLDSRATSRSSEDASTSRLLRRIRERHLKDMDIVVQVLMRTGRYITQGLPQVLEGAHQGEMGDPKRVLPLLEDLFQVAFQDDPKMEQGDETQPGYTEDVFPIEFAEESKAIARSTTLEGKAGPGRSKIEGEGPREGVLKKAYSWMLRILNAGGITDELEVIMVGLPGSGKTNLLRHLAKDDVEKDSLSRTGFVVKQIRRDSVAVKLWEISGQLRFRRHWERYCKGASCIIFVVDSYDVARLDEARAQLHHLMGRESLQGIPLLVLGNESSEGYKRNKITADGLSDRLDLKSLSSCEVFCYGVDAADERMLELVVEFLLKLPRG